MPGSTPPSSWLKLKTFCGVYAYSLGHHWRILSNVLKLGQSKGKAYQYLKHYEVKWNRRFILLKMCLSAMNSFHIVINCMCPSQGRSCAPASFRAVPWTVPSASRRTSTTVRSVSADRGPRSANPFSVTSTVPLDTCTYSHS